MRAWAPVSFISLLSLVVVFGEGCRWGARAAGARLGKHDAPRSGEGRRGAHARDGARALRNYEDAGRGTHQTITLAPRDTPGATPDQPTGSTGARRSSGTNPSALAAASPTGAKSPADR